MIYPIGDIIGVSIYIRETIRYNLDGCEGAVELRDSELAPFIDKTFILTDYLGIDLLSHI